MRTYSQVSWCDPPLLPAADEGPRRAQVRLAGRPSATAGVVREDGSWRAVQDVGRRSLEVAKSQLIRMHQHGGGSGDEAVWSRVHMRLLDAFRAFDRDGNGVLSRQELTDGLQGAALHPHPACSAMIWAMQDRVRQCLMMRVMSIEHGV
jgi:hypothetical protein